MHGVDGMFVIILALIFDRETSGCQNPKIIRLTEPRGVIHTNNFPNRFSIPLCIHWIIDSQLPYVRTHNGTKVNYNNGKRIRIYLTQVYLTENLTYVDYFNYPFDGPPLSSNEDEKNSVRRKSETLISGYNSVPIPGEIHGTDSSAIGYATSSRFFGVQVEISSPFPVHYRARNFLHSYGFNITYEIVDEAHHNLDFGNSGECNLRNCSYAGNCLVTSDFRGFYCDCLPGRYGLNCEYSDQCDPKRKITFCRNGGICRMMAAGVGTCSCPAGYRGQLCGLKIDTSVKECPGPQYKDGKTIPKGWMRYEVMLQALQESLPEYTFRPESSGSIPPEVIKKKVQIEDSLKKKLGSIQGIHGNDTGVTIVSFASASKIFFQFFGPNDTITVETLKAVLLNGSLFPLRELSQTFQCTSYPALALRKLVRGRPNEILKVGESFDLTCEAEGSRRITFKWFKDGFPINPSFSVREINERKHFGLNSFVSTSILMLSSSTISDRGEFTCQVSDMGEEQCMNFQIELVAPPYIEMEPMSLTLQKDEEERIILCSSEFESITHNYSYNWAKNGNLILNNGYGTNEIIEKLDPYGSLLRIMRAEISTNYTCIVTNVAGQNWSTVEVQVLDSQYLAFCRHEQDEYNVTWNQTALGQMSKRSCPPGFVGFAQRICYNSTRHPLPRWGQSDFSKCVSKELRDLSKSIQRLQMGFANNTQIFSLIQRLVDDLTNKTSLYTGEGETIIGILENLGNYAILKKNIIDKTNDTFLRSFLNATTKLLGFAGSCSSPKSIITLSNIVHRFAMEFPSQANRLIWNSDVFVLEKLQMNSLLYTQPLIFPLKRIGWANVLLQISNPMEMHTNFGISSDAKILLFVIFRNLTSIVSPTAWPSSDYFPHFLKLGTPIISITNYNYTMNRFSEIKLTFNLSLELAQDIKNKKSKVTCAGMSSYERDKKILWTENACPAHGPTNDITVHCLCEHFGQFGLLFFDMEKKPEGLNLDIHWSVILGTVVLIVGCSATLIIIIIHIGFQFSTNSLYSLKLIACITLIFSHLFVLSLRTEAYSIPLSTSLCSILILSLSCQLTAPLSLLVSDKIEFYPWLRSVSILSFTFGIFIALTLPIWTAAAAMSHSRTTMKYSNQFDDENTSVLSENTSVFGVFVGMISLILVGFCIFCYKANSKLQNLRSKVDIGKNHCVDYRIKILSRAIFVTAATLFTTVSGILTINSPGVLLYQYFLGLATFTTGIVVFLCYTIKSEYPIPERLTHCFSTKDILSDVRDPDKHSSHRHLHSRTTNSRTPEKCFENNHHVASILSNELQHDQFQHRDRTTTFDSINSAQVSEPNTTMETIGGSSTLSTSSGRRDSFLMRTSSVSTDKRPSVGSNGLSISKSMTNPSSSHQCSSTRPLLQQPTHAYSKCCNKNRTRRSISSTGGSCTQIKPDRGRCLLRQIESSDYVLPSKSNIISENGTGSIQTIAIPSSMTSTDLVSGYVDVEKGSKGNSQELNECSTFKPIMFLQNSNDSGNEVHYESIPSRSGSMKDITLSNNLLEDHIPSNDLDTLKNSINCEKFPSKIKFIPSTTLPISNGRIQMPGTFKTTDPLPPTPAESPWLNQASHMTKSNSIVQCQVSQDLDNFDNQKILGHKDYSDKGVVT